MENTEKQNSEITGPYDPKSVEDKIYAIWEKSGFFAPEAHQSRADNPNKNKTFTITIPPPNVTGSLHMGHALNATIQDILIRKKRMGGYKTLWLPGTDHAGIATQNVVEKELKKEGLNRHDIGKEKLLEQIWEWKEKYGNKILEQLKKIGASCDFTRTRFTMDNEYQQAVKEAFLHYYKAGLIYQAERVINWCKRCETSLSDLELEYKEEKTKLWHIKYPISKNSTQITPASVMERDENPKQIRNSESKIQDYIIVATTRPETMLGDTAIMVNPKDERYKNLIGKKAILPIINREIPIIADKSVDINFGTGAVKITPAHSIIDAEIGKRHNLETVKVIGGDGRFGENSMICNGLNILDCRAKILNELQSNNLLAKEENYIHNLALCYRCGTIVENIPSKQWFLKMEGLAKKALQAVKSGKIKFHPKKWEKTYFNWLSNIRDWCISRQIWWGHQIPVWYCEKDIAQHGHALNREVEKDDLKLYFFDKKVEEIKYFVSKEKPKKCPFCKNCEMVQETDVLDTWFSSALWPFATLGWPKKTKDLKNYYPTQVLSTDRGIISLWVARMIFSGLEFMKKNPFRDVIIHATVLTKEGKRMSKSLGTGIDPMDLIEKYGADATRFGLMWQTMGGQDIHWSEEHVLAGKKFANKIWNASRFVLQQISKPACPVGRSENRKSEIKSKFQIPNSKNLTKEDKKIIKELNKIIKITGKHIENYEFGQSLHKLYDFFWHEFCDKYLEISKKQLENEKTRPNTEKILLSVLINSLKLIHPFMPFITEEIWSRVPQTCLLSKQACLSGRQENKKLLIIEEWPK